MLLVTADTLRDAALYTGIAVACCHAVVRRP